MNFRRISKIGMAIAILCLSTNTFAVTQVQAKAETLASAKLDDAIYNVSYDSFVLGALPLWISRTFDDGPKHLVLRIQFEGSPAIYENVDFVDGTELQITYNQYAGPGFVEISIDSIIPF